MKRIAIAGAIFLFVLAAVMWYIDGVEYDRTVNEDWGVVYNHAPTPQEKP